MADEETAIHAPEEEEEWRPSDKAPMPPKKNRPRQLVLPGQCDRPSKMVEPPAPVERSAEARAAVEAVKAEEREEAAARKRKRRKKTLRSLWRRTFPFWRKVWAWMRLPRINQWTKNGVVLVPFFFALGDQAQQAAKGWRGTWDTWLLAVAAAVAFGLVSSAVYILNDWRDRAVDALHPVKKNRPIASGDVPGGPALALAALLAAGGIAGAWRFANPGTAWVLAGYLAMQAAYSLRLKRVAILDVMIIAAGFVLRAIAGAVAVRVDISPWLLLCAFWLALFLALCKRRHEKSKLGAAAREALAQYDKKVLDLSIAATAATALVSYSLYTLWPDTVAKFRTQWLGVTIPFVAFGLFRYLELVYRHERGERPEAVLLTDVPLMIDIALFGAAVMTVFWFARG